MAERFPVAGRVAAEEQYLAVAQLLSAAGLHSDAPSVGLAKRESLSHW